MIFVCYSLIFDLGISLFFSTNLIQVLCSSFRVFVFELEGVTFFWLILRFEWRILGLIYLL
jgi:hypothetical protein